MKFVLAVVVCFTMLASAQQNKAAKTPSSDASALASSLESHVRKAWKDYQERNKQAFAAILAPGFAEVTDGADGAVGKDEELSEMDHFTLTHYDLSNFKVRPLGSTAALVRYSAKYDGSYDKTPLDMKTMYGEVWVKSGSDWKLLWVQETKLK